MKAKDLEKLFDQGQNITKCLDLSRAVRPGEQAQRVNVDLFLTYFDGMENEARPL